MVIRLLCYFVPLAVNMLAGGVMFICSYRFSINGCSGLVTSGAVAVWGGVYCLTNFAIKRVVRPANALHFIFAGTVAMVAASLGFILTEAWLYGQFLWIGLIGFGDALFCMPFQLLAKAVESEERPGTVQATAFYTFSWSVGFATGPLFFAKFVREGFYINLGLALALAAAVLGIASLRRPARGEAAKSVADAPAEVSPQEVRSRDVFALLGWIVGGMGTLAVSMIRALWPHHGEAIGVSQMHIALTTALVSYVQGVTALLLFRSAHWMFRRAGVAAFSLLGVVSLGVFALARSVPLFYLAAAGYGICSGCVYFYLVYHSLAHPTRSEHFVSGNEVIVGVISTAAPMLGGVLADRFDTPAPFVFAAGALLLAWIIQTLTVTFAVRNTEELKA